MKDQAYVLDWQDHPLVRQLFTFYMLVDHLVANIDYQVMHRLTIILTH